MEPSQNTQTQKNRSVWHSVKEWIQIIATALVISLPIRFFIAEPFIVNGASMDPTFSTGQFLIVDRVTYRFEEPNRGDVIVFEFPNKQNVYYIKRIIGLPGETIEIKNGRVTIINETDPSKNITLDEPYVEDIHTSRDNLKVKLNSTEYFVMGDNRAQSSDSRTWGALEKHFIVGRPIIRLFPVSTLSILPGK